MKIKVNFESRISVNELSNNRVYGRPIYCYVSLAYANVFIMVLKGFFFYFSTGYFQRYLTFYFLFYIY